VYCIFALEAMEYVWVVLCEFLVSVCVLFNLSPWNFPSEPIWLFFDLDLHNMEISGNAKRLRVLVSSTDTFKHKPLYEVIVFLAKRYGLAGATVTKGLIGYGSTSGMRTRKPWDMTEKVPIVVEIVDTEEQIDRFIEILKPYFERIPKGGLITTETADIVLYQIGRKGRPKR